MSGNAIIYLTNQGLAIFRWNKNSLLTELQLPDPTMAVPQLINYFSAKGHGGSIRLVVDLFEETYALESLPHLNEKDRKALIQRKKKQLFSNSGFVYSKPKGRSDNDRKDDLVLFASITEEAYLEQWLQALFAAKLTISGIFSLPIISEKIVAKLAGGINKFLISITQEQQGIFLRQMFFQNNVLALSRAKYFTGYNEKELLEEIKEDINRSSRFLVRHFKIFQNDQLSTYCFCSSAELLQKLRTIDFSAMQLSPVWHINSEFASLSGDNVPEGVGFSAYIGSKFARNWFVKPHYQNQLSHFYYRHYLMRIGLNASTTAILCFGVLYSLYTLLLEVESNEKLLFLQLEQQRYERRLNNSKTAPLINGFNPFEIAAQLRLRNQLDNRLIFPEAFLNPISHKLTQYPTIILTKLDWGMQAEGNDQSEVFIIHDTTLGGPIVEQEQSEIGIPIILQARIEPFDGNYRHALALIERFRTELGMHARIKQVIATKLPVDLTSEQGISGAIRNQDRKSEFILEMQWQRQT